MYQKPNEGDYILYKILVDVLKMDHPLLTHPSILHIHYALYKFHLNSPIS